MVLDTDECRYHFRYQISTTNDGVTTPTEWLHRSYSQSHKKKQKQLENASGEMESKWSNDLIFEVHTCSTEL